MSTVLEGQRYIKGGLRIVRIQKDEEGSILVLLHDRIRVDSDGDLIVYNKHHAFCVKRDGAMASDTVVDNERMQKALPSKNMRGNNSQVYEAFATLYDGLEKRNQAFNLKNELEEKSVTELMKTMDEIRMGRRRMGMAEVSGLRSR